MNEIPADIIEAAELAYQASAVKVSGKMERAELIGTIARAILAERQRAWQPIETAPKDGTEILLYREDCGVMLGRWIACCEFIADGDPGNDFCPEGNDEAWEEPDWFGADFIQGYRITNDGAPTHWQPLPAPPETEREAME